MKRAIFLFFVLLVVFLSACGRRQIIVQVPQAPKPSSAPTTQDQKKKAEKAANRVAKAEGKLLEAKVWSGLECQDDASWDKVGVALRVKLRSTLLSAFSQGKAVLRIVNPDPFTVSIYDERGWVVKDLCPYGSVSVRRQLDVFAGDGNYLNFSWTARALIAGVLYTDEGPRFRLSSYNYSYRNLRVGIWELDLRRSRGRKRRY